MKKSIYSLLIVLAIVVTLPSESKAQNGKSAKKEKTEKVTKTKKVILPSTPEPPAAPVPPGQVGKTEQDDKIQGYEKTGDKGEKEGWDKDKAPGINDKATAKELKKAERKRNKELRKARKMSERKLKKETKRKSVDFSNERD
jgi:hypothetical protein